MIKSRRYRSTMRLRGIKVKKISKREKRAGMAQSGVRGYQEAERMIDQQRVEQAEELTG